MVKTLDSDGNSIRLRVLNYIRVRGPRGATSDEVEQALCVVHQTCCARIFDLRHPKSGGPYVRDSGLRRMTRSGMYNEASGRSTAQAIVWVAVLNRRRS